LAGFKRSAADESFCAVETRFGGISDGDEINKGEIMKITEKLLVINKLGLHLRAAAELVKVANKFKSQTTIHHGIQNVNAKSLMGLMTLAAAKGTELEFECDGPDAKEAITALKQLFEHRFGEKE
jgi:phosphocarrier protein